MAAIPPRATGRRAVLVIARATGAGSVEKIRRGALHSAAAGLRGPSTAKKQSGGAEQEEYQDCREQNRLASLLFR